MISIILKAKKVNYPSCAKESDKRVFVRCQTDVCYGLHDFNNHTI
jgi:hypothetical protein